MIAENSNQKDSEIDVSNTSIILSDADLQEAANYFHKKATLEVKHFTKEKQYKDISVERMIFYITVDAYCHIKNLTLSPK